MAWYVEMVRASRSTSSVPGIRLCSFALLTFCASYTNRELFASMFGWPLPFRWSGSINVIAIVDGGATPCERSA